MQVQMQRCLQQRFHEFEVGLGPTIRQEKPEAHIESWAALILARVPPMEADSLEQEQGKNLILEVYHQGHKINESVKVFDSGTKQPGNGNSLGYS